MVESEQLRSNGNRGHVLPPKAKSQLEIENISADGDLIMLSGLQDPGRRRRKSLSIVASK